MTINTQKNCLLHVNHFFTFFFNFQVRWWKKLGLSSASSKKREGRLWSTDSSLFPLISKSVKILSFVSTHLGNLSFFLIIVFKKCVWGLNWPFRNLWALTSRVTFWSVSCYYHKNRQQWFILQKGPIFADETVALFPLGVIWSHSVYYEPG